MKVQLQGMTLIFTTDFRGIADGISFNVPQLTTAASLGVRNKYPKTVIGRATAFEFPSLEDVNKLEFYGNNFTR